MRERTPFVPVLARPQKLALPFGNERESFVLPASIHPERVTLSCHSEMRGQGPFEVDVLIVTRELPSICGPTMIFPGGSTAQVCCRLTSQHLSRVLPYCDWVAEATFSQIRQCPGIQLLTKYPYGLIPHGGCALHNHTSDVMLASERRAGTSHKCLNPKSAEADEEESLHARPADSGHKIQTPCGQSSRSACG